MSGEIRHSVDMTRAVRDIGLRLTEAREELNQAIERRSSDIDCGKEYQAALQKISDVVVSFRSELALMVREVDIVLTKLSEEINTVVVQDSDKRYLAK